MLAAEFLRGEITDFDNCVKVGSDGSHLHDVFGYDILYD
jgi:hypothetical protein